MRFGRFVEISRGRGSTRQPQRTEPCQCVSVQPWACHGALQGQMQPLMRATGVVAPALKAAAELGGWFVELAVLLVCGHFQRKRQHSAAIAHKALPVCEWPAMGLSWDTARPTAASAVYIRFVRACTGGCGRSGQVVCGGCGFAGLWIFPEEKAALGKPQRTEPCQYASGQPWACHGALQGQMQQWQQYATGVVEPALGTTVGLGRWCVGVATVLPVCGDFQRKRQHSATSAHRALPVCRWPALGMPWGTARLNAASAVCSRLVGGACTGGCGRAWQVVCGDCGFASLLRFPEEEAALGNWSAQSPASV